MRALPKKKKDFRGGEQSLDKFFVTLSFGGAPNIVKENIDSLFHHLPCV